MEQHVEDFLVSLRGEQGYAHNTILAYRDDLYQLEQFLYKSNGANDWTRVHKQDLALYVSSLKTDRDYAPATIARKVSVVRSLFHYLLERGVVQDDPTIGLDSPKVRKFLPTSLSEEDVATLLETPLRHKNAHSLRDCAILEILYGTGICVAELIALDVGDVNIPSLHCAGKKRRTISIYPRAARALDRYLSDGRAKMVRDDQERALFVNHRGHRLGRQGLWLIVKKYVAEAGIQAVVTPHTLRYSFATHLLRDGVDIREVQELLGHADVSSTRAYAQVGHERLHDIYGEPDRASDSEMPAPVSSAR